jgi:chromate transport protein ChrA
MSSPPAPFALTAHLALLSSISFGGFPTVLPDVRDFVVATHGWVTDQEFTNFFALAQSIPGPNMILMMSFIGWHVWGFPGALASAFATLRTPLRHVLRLLPPMGSLPQRAMATDRASRPGSR